jgi:hypothetical protein
MEIKHIKVMLFLHLKMFFIHAKINFKIIPSPSNYFIPIKHITYKCSLVYYLIFIMIIEDFM